MLTKPRYFGVIHKNENVRMSSRSGGAFTALSDYVLQNDGVVYGCILNDVQQAVHIRTVSSEERNQMRGSKYVQSDMGTCFEQVRKDLCDGRKVLFSGTSCQVDGLKSFLAATKTEGDIVQTYHYDRENRLTGVTDDAETVFIAKYDYRSRVLKKRKAVIP